MKLNDSRENYYFYSGKTSDIVRYMALAGFGVIWALKSEFALEGVSKIYLPYALIFLGITILLDLMQYVIGTALWGIYNRKQEIKLELNEQKNISPGKYFNWPTLIPFWLKVITIFIAYTFILLWVIQLSPQLL